MRQTKYRINKSIDFIEKHYNVFFILIMLVALFNIFYRINVNYIEFDEARHGISAYEMLKSHNFIINTYMYKNDYWNLKPVLSFWIIMLGYKLVGFNMVGLRLFSSISALFTVFVVGLFVKDKYSKLASLISIMVLATTSQYILSHCARAGEADALYVFLYTLAIISIMYINKSDKFLYLSCFLASLAFLTKSWHAATIYITIVMYIFVSGYFRKLNIKKCMLFFMSGILPILIWALVRFSYDGLIFFKDMVQYDLLARSSKSIEGHVGGIFYYFIVILFCYGPLLILFIGCLISYITSKNKSFKRIVNTENCALILWTCIPVVLFSMAKTKIDWYILPVYPPLAICVGVLFSKILKDKNVKRVFRITLAVVVIGIIAGEQLIIAYEISSIKEDNIQIAISEMCKDNKYKHRDIYTISGYYSKTGVWQQQHALAAELCGDFIVKNGGLKAFLNSKDNNSVIIAPINNETKINIEKYNLKIVNAQNNFYLISR